MQYLHFVPEILQFIHSFIHLYFITRFFTQKQLNITIKRSIATKIIIKRVHKETEGKNIVVE